MEYHMPSQFNQNGFNVMNPGVQMMGGVGYNPTPQSFTYNGENPYLTYLQNQNYNYDDYCKLGNDASSFLQQAQQTAMNVQQPQQQYYYNPIYGYNQQPYYSEQDVSQAYNQMYDNNQMSITDYCYYNNGGINTTSGNRFIQQDISDDWYGYAMRDAQRRQLQQEEYQKEYNNQMYAWSVCTKLSNNYYDRENDSQDIEKKAAYFNKLNQYKQACAQDEYQMDCFAAFVKSLPNSTQPGYVSPLKENIVTHWNNYYHERNDKYPEHYTIDDYFNKGIMGCMMIDLYAHDAKLKEKEMRAKSLFSREAFKNYMHELVPSYDPKTETGLIFNTTIGGGIQDIEIRLPEHLAREEYAARKQRFMDTIFADNRSNLKGAI